MKLSPLLVAALFLGGPVAAAGPPAELFAECEGRFAKDPQGEFSCGCFYSIATREPGQADAALARLETHLRRDPGSGCLLFTLGRIESLLRRPGAEARQAAAAVAYAAQGQAAGETYARLNLTDLLAARGDLAGAEVQLDLAATAAAAAAGAAAGGAGPSSRSYLPAEVEIRRARLWLSRGEPLENVEALLRAAQAHVFPGGYDSLKRDTLETLGDVVHRLGRFDEAEAIYRRMIEVTRHTNWSGRSDLYGEATARQSLAAAHLSRPPSPENRAASLRLLEEALAAAENAGHRVAEAEARRLIGRLRGGPEGRRQLERSLAIAAELDDPYLLRQGLAALAAETVAGDPPGARALLDRLDRLDRIDRINRISRIDTAGPAPGGTENLALYGWSARFAVAWATSERPQAIARALAELRAIEALREAPADSLTRAELFSAWAEAYSWLAGRLLEAGEAGPAFDLLERRHARTLLDAAPENAGAGTSFATLAETQAALGQDEAFLYFQQAYENGTFGDFAGGSWLLVLTRGNARIYRSASPLEVDPLVPAFSGLLARGGDGAAAAARFESLLFGQALAELPAGISRLAVLPDEDLQLLPFAALRATPDGPGLAERYQLVTVPSATLWNRWRSAAPAPAPHAVLALADPVAAASAAKGREPLPGARREGRLAARALGGASVLRLGEQAGEAALAATELAPFGMLHFAAHAEHGRAGLRSERTALVLAPGPGDDGLLQPREIRRLRLAGKAVVLAACRGAEGEVLAGEGALSLAHAFFGAGAEVVVASLWNLEDQAAARFSERFYRRLAAGEKAGAAFAAAQKESIAAGEPAADWAGLVLLGNGDWRMAPAPPAPATALRPAVLAALAVAVFAAAALLVAWRRSGQAAKLHK